MRRKRDYGAEHTVPKILLRELRRPGGFVVALVVGGTLTVTRRFESLAAFLPFVVPFLVSLVTRISARVASRRRELLLDLPGYRRDPAFVMDCAGRIVAAVGETQTLLERNDIEDIDHFLDGPDTRHASSVLLEGGGTQPDYPLFSPVTQKWYRVQLHGESGRGDILIWLDDVTEQVRLEERKDALRVFTHRLQDELLQNETYHDDDTKLAQLLLAEGYQGILLARLDRSSSPTRDSAGSEAHGVLYTSDGRRSDSIMIPRGADAPIMRSRREKRAIWDDIERWSSHEEFRRTYPVLPEVSAFIGTEVCNFANYHSGDVSIIAFNREGSLGPTDIAVLESAADTAVTAFSLLDLARRADRRFIQSIHGVCAAAEYSDELTGGHIWRVNDYSRHVAQLLGMSERTSEEIGTVAAMHDIGKVAMPHLIKLPRALDRKEREEMQMHTIYGAQIIERMRSAGGESDSRLVIAERIALHHHQHWNGSGYPALVDESGEFVIPESRRIDAYQNLSAPSGMIIPREALIVSLADKYDALRSCRQYKPAFSHEKTVKLLAEDDRTGLRGPDVFGPEIYEAFMDCHGAFDEIYTKSQNEPLCAANDATEPREVTETSEQNG